MPVLRSQKSKGKASSKRRGGDEEEMPPPAPVTPPRKRTTRGKKASKKVEEVDITSDDTKSPAPSTSSTSTRSTRGRPRKVVKKVEEIEMASPPPPSTRSTRPARQKATTSKSVESDASNGETTKGRKVGKVDLNPEVQISPLVAESKKRGPIVPQETVKKGRGRPKKVKRPFVDSHSCDDLTTEDESDAERRAKGFTLEQLHKQHVIPMKTCLNTHAEVLPKLLTKLKDNGPSEKQEKEFQRLMNLNVAESEMPPPAAPAAKPKGKVGKLRQKRARSPEKTPTKVPDSFDFARKDPKNLVPASKKMLLDQSTPEKEDVQDVAPVTDEKSADQPIAYPASSQPKVTVTEEKKVEKEKKKKVEQPIANPTSSQPKDTVTEEKKVEKEKKKKVEQPIANPTSSQPKVTVTEEKKVDKEKKKKVEPEMKQLEVVNVSKKSNKEEDQFADIFELSTMDDGDYSVDAPRNSVPVSTADTDTQTKIVSTDTDKKQSEKTTTDAVVDVAAVEAPKKSKAMDATYVFQTPKENEQINATFTPELFTDTPKSRIADQTIVISKHANESKDKVKDEDEILTPATPEPKESQSSTNSVAASSTSGKVTSLVNFFDKSKKEVEGTKKENPSCNKTIKDEMNLTTTISSANHNGSTYTNKAPPCKDLNSTYVLPISKKANNASSGMMNVTMCVKKAAIPEMEEAPAEKGKQGQVQPIAPPSFIQQTGTSRFMHDSPLSRTFVKEPPCLAVVEEEDDDGKESVTSASSGQKIEKIRPLVPPKLLHNEKEKVKEKTGSTSSSSSSGSSMKSAISQPSLHTIKKHPVSASKTGPTYGSTGKLNEIQKSKPLEEAEKRRQELLQQKVESSKKKNAEWSKKTEKAKLEEEKRLKEKKKVVSTLPSSQPTSASSVLKKPVPMSIGKNALDGATGGLGFTKPKFNFGPSTKMGGPMPPLSKNPFHKPMNLPPPPPEADTTDDSFRSANNANSFLDQTTEGHLSSYDITVYEDLDEDLKHRENKTVPNWASDKESLGIALFSMVLLPDYESRLLGGFPKPDKNYKLFPTRPRPPYE